MRTLGFTRLLSAITLSTLTSIVCYAAGYPWYSSKVPGVALWDLQAGAVDFISESDKELDVSKDIQDFLSHCNGKNQVYVYEMKAQAFTCKAESVNVYGNNIYRIHVGDGQLSLNGVFTVSMKKIADASWVFKPLDAEEKTIARRTVVSNKPSPPKGADYEYYPAVGDPEFEHYEGKFILGSKELLVIPTSKSLGMSTILYSTILLKEGKSYSFIGHLEGCLVQQYVDIDGDGVPEVMVQYCDSAGGIIREYWRIYPKVEQLVTYGVS